MTRQFDVDVTKLVLVEDASVGSGYRFVSQHPGGADPNLGIPASLYEVVLCKEVMRLGNKIREQEIVICRHERNAKRRRDRRKKKC